MVAPDPHMPTTRIMPADAIEAELIHVEVALGVVPVLQSICTTPWSWFAASSGIAIVAQLQAVPPVIGTFRLSPAFVPLAPPSLRPTHAAMPRPPVSDVAVFVV